MGMNSPSTLASLVVLVLCLLHGSNSAKVYICKGGAEKTIQCPNNAKVMVTSANLARNRRDVCNGSGNSWFTWCSTISKLQQVKEACDGTTNTCSFNEDVFEPRNEDACGNEVKLYLEVDYHCDGAVAPTSEPPPVTPKNEDYLVEYKDQNQMICEFDRDCIQCPSDLKINVTSVYWGRRENDERCISNWYSKSPNATSKCQQKTIDADCLLENLQRDCNFKDKCLFRLPKWSLGNPCPNIEVSKYLEIVYDCIVRKARREVAHGNSSEIQCQEGRVIKILEGWYGKLGGASETTKCGVDVKASLEAVCGGSHGCQVIARDNQFPEINDCTENNGGADLMIMYICTSHTNNTVPQATKAPITTPINKTELRNVSTPDGKSRFLGCGQPLPTIFVKEAWYGSEGRECFVNITNIIDYGCTGYVFCQLTADIGVFGDPQCPDNVEKKLYVQFWCGPTVPRPPSDKEPPVKNATRGAASMGVNDAKCGMQSISRVRRVISGTSAQAGRWPWQAEIYTWHNTHQCGGALISSKWILSAAHCYSESSLKDADKKYYVVLGEVDRTRYEGHEYKYKVRRIIRHRLFDSQFDSIPHDYDIALIELQEHVNMTQYIGTACVPSSAEKDTDYFDDCFLTGWGKSRFPGGSVDMLQQGLFKVVTNPECQTKLNTDALGKPGTTITQNMICANDKLGIGVSGCQGDSGGPFVCRHKRNGKWYLRGVVSWGSQRCNINDMFQVLTRIAAFDSWTTQQINV